MVQILFSFFCKLLYFVICIIKINMLTLYFQNKIKIDLIINFRILK